MPFALIILFEKQNKIICNSKGIACDHMTIGFDAKKFFYNYIKGRTHQHDMTVGLQILKKKKNL